MQFLNYSQFRMRRCKGKKMYIYKNLNTISCQTANGNIQIIFEWCINVWWMLISRNKIKIHNGSHSSNFFFIYSQKRTFRSWELTLASQNNNNKKKLVVNNFVYAIKLHFYAKSLLFGRYFFYMCLLPEKKKHIRCKEDNKK